MSHDERFKARDKKTHRMTRDGLIERNAATGEERRISQRGQEFKLRDRLSDDMAARGHPPDLAHGRHSQRRPQALPREEAIPRMEQPQAADASRDTRRMDADSRGGDTAHTVPGASHFLDTAATALPAEPAVLHRSGEQARHPRQHGSRYQRQFQTDTQGGMDSPVQDADNAPLSDAPPCRTRFLLLRLGEHRRLTPW